MKSTKQTSSIIIDHLRLPGKKPPSHNKMLDLEDYRGVSARWFTGICITGITSCLLMGMALFSSALNLKMEKQIVNPYDFSQQTSKVKVESNDDKRTRIAATRTRKITGHTQQIELSTLQKVNEKEVIRSQTFELVEMFLAENHDQNFEYPEFNPLSLFDHMDFVPEQLEKSSHLYGAKIETEVTLKSSYFPNTGMIFTDNNAISLNQAEQHIRIKQLGYDLRSIINNDRDQKSTSTLSAYDSVNVKIISENVSSLSKSSSKNFPEYTEDILPISPKRSFLDILRNAGYEEGEDVQRISHVLTIMEKEDKNKEIKKQEISILRLGIRNLSGKDVIVRASIYRNGIHRLSIALNDHDQYIQCTEPEMPYSIKSFFKGGIPVSRLSVKEEHLPTVYHAIFQAVLARNMTKNTAEELIRMLSNDIDVQSRISPDDSLRFFYPLEEQDKEGIKQKIFYVDAQFGNIHRRYYRHQSNNGYIDYYDSDGKSSKQFLLRKPVPNGVFRSPFGLRRHPILGYMKMHSGVDWSAPHGSPIIAVGNGTIIRAEWYRGYGNQIVISHANGYTSSYSHQSSFAHGIRNGMNIKQGQVIGYVGSTGLSTGPHCHFEIAINGVKVDPMHIRFNN